jgi:hypothetical protein
MEICESLGCVCDLLGRRERDALCETGGDGVNRRGRQTRLACQCAAAVVLMRGDPARDDSRIDIGAAGSPGTTSA